MSKQADVFNYAVDLFGLECSPVLPTGNGFAVQIAPSSIDTHYLNRETAETMAILLLGKNDNQVTVANSLYDVCNNLKNHTSYDLGIYNIEPANMPSFVDKDGDYYIWQVIINVKFMN